MQKWCRALTFQQQNAIACGDRHLCEFVPFLVHPCFQAAAFTNFKEPSPETFIKLASENGTEAHGQTIDLNKSD